MFIVVIIFSVLLALTVPLIRKLTVGSGVNPSIQAVAGQIRLGRRYALTKRTKIAIIMPGPSATNIDDDKRYSCLRLAYVEDKNPPDEYQFTEWMEDTQWVFLAKNASILEADDDIGVQTGSTYVKTPNDDLYTQVDGVPLLGIGGGDTDNVRALVFTSTGRVAGPTRYVTIGDAVYQGAWIVRYPADIDTNKSCANQVTIELNVYTGNADVKQPPDY